MRPAVGRFRIDDEDVAWREVGDEVVVLHMATATYLTVNGTGRTLWSLLVEGATREELVDELSSQYAIEMSRAEADVDAFLVSLRACQLLSEDAAGAGCAAE